MTPLVHVVDDDPGFRDSLRSLLESDGLEVETYADAGDFLARYAPGRPGCLLVDVRMPGMSGLQLQDELQRRRIDVPTVFVTAHGDVAMAVRAVRRGAMDFVEKPFDDESMIRRVREALDADATRRGDSLRRSDFAARLDALSEREREVLERVVEGKLNKLIADELRITVKTVEFHRARIMEKLRAKSLADLVNRFVEDKLTRS